VADRPAAGAAGASMRAARSGWSGKRREGCASMEGKQRVPAPPSGQSTGAAAFAATCARI
jgi:hypothetical protein